MPGSPSASASRGDREEFAAQVRDALGRLYDPVHLQTHPLAARVARAGDRPERAARVLRQSLLDAIALLRPAGKTSESSPAWRAYQLLQLRYVEALSPEQVQEQLGLARAQYFREQRRALAAVVSVLAAQLARSADAPGGTESGASAGPSDGPRDGAAPSARPALPYPVSSFVGRERELAAIQARLRGGDARLLTLVGAGGSGKTRLALEAARGLLDAFPDGVYFVELQAITDPALVAPAIVRAAGITLVGGTPPHVQLTAALRERAALLVLDNFEQLIAPGCESCGGVDAAALVCELLAAAPALRVLVTSRVPLRLRAEHVLEVPPLALLDERSATADLAANEAVRLLVERARAAVPGFDLSEANAPALAGICRRLDGLPLAIELAAPRLAVFTPEVLRDRLERRLPLLTGGARDLPARHRALRDTIAWSYDLLSESQRALFRRLGVFAGGCTLEAIGAVTCPGETASPRADEAVENDLAALVEASLLRRVDDGEDGPRFSLLETVREYALERLEAHGEATGAARTHAAYYLDLAERAAPELRGERETEWLDRLERERDNLRGALDHFVAHGDLERELRLAAALWRYWQDRGHLAEAERRLTAALERARAAAPALKSAAWVAWQEVRFVAAIIAASRGDYRRARELKEESAAAARESGDVEEIAWAVWQLAGADWHEGDGEAALAHYREALALQREIGDRRGMSWNLAILGSVLCFTGDLAAADAALDEAGALFEQTGDQGGLYRVTVGRAHVAERKGDYDAARAILERLAVSRRPQHIGNVADHLTSLSYVSARLGDAGAARAHCAELLALWSGNEHRMRVGNHLAAYAALAALEGRAADALRLAGAAAGRLNELRNDPTGNMWLLRLDEAVAPARRALGESEQVRHWTEGRAMPVEDAIALAGTLLEDPEAAPTHRCPRSTNDAARCGLTPRQIEVLRLVAQGMSDRQIAAELVISEKTVGRHLENVFDKLAVSSRAAATAAALRLGLT